MEKAQSLFPRVDMGEKAGTERAEPGTPKPAFQGKPPMAMEDFQKGDLRVARILDAETIQGSKKLLKLTVDVGETRTVVAGIAQHYAPQDIVGKLVVLVANLPPAKIMGVTSQGMVLAAVHGDSLTLVTVDGESEPGAPVL